MDKERKNKRSNDHVLTMEDLILILTENDCKSNWKIVRDDMDTLMVFGYGVLVTKESKYNVFHIANRGFDLLELKILLDMVSSSRFLAATISNKLIKKVAYLASSYQYKFLITKIHCR